MPSADIWSNRCIPLRGTSAGYASASSAFIWLLKSGSERVSLRWVNNTAGIVIRSIPPVIYFLSAKKSPQQRRALH